MAYPRIIAAIVAAFILAPPVLAAGNTFLVECEDLPLAPGLTELPGGTLFESPNGRIVEATATGNLAGQEVQSFYAATLPQLGWEKVGSRSFRRDKEFLSIDIEDKAKPLSVRFSVVPR